jgi:hypothetical protein
LHSTLRYKTKQCFYSNSCPYRTKTLAHSQAHWTPSAPAPKASQTRKVYCIALFSAPSTGAGTISFLHRGAPFIRSLFHFGPLRFSRVTKKRTNGRTNEHSQSLTQPRSYVIFKVQVKHPPLAGLRLPIQAQSRLC